MNTRSVRKKLNDFVHYSVTEDLDFCVITESWIKDDDLFEINSLQPPGYDFKNVQRQGRGGGGIGIFHKSNITSAIMKSGELSSFEFIHIDVRISLIVIYRPPYSEQHPITLSVFFDEFSDFVADVLLTTNRCILLGDFNIHVNDANDADASSFLELLESFALIQLVTPPTHISGNTLDLIVVRENSDLVVSNIVTDHYISDHCYVIANISTSRPILERKEINFRRIKAINQLAFRSDISEVLDSIKWEKISLKLSLSTMTK